MNVTVPAMKTLKRSGIESRSIWGVIIVCGCNESMNSGVIADAMKGKCVMYYLNTPFVLFNLFKKKNPTRILSRTKWY